MSRKRLLELRRSDLEALRMIEEATEILRRNREERERIESSLFRLPGPELSFDDLRRGIVWHDRTIRLGQKSYLFVKTLWQGGDRHRAKIERIESVVFKVGDGHRKMFLSVNTLRSFVNRLCMELKKQSFPYEIRNIKEKKTQEIRGYFLKCTTPTHPCD